TLNTAHLGGKPVAWENPSSDTRRSVYGMIDRYKLDPMLSTFDFPNPDLHAPQRFETAVPQQTLYLLNSPFILRHAERIAEQLERIGPPDLAGEPTPITSLDQRVRHLYRQVLQRDPRPGERAIALDFLQEGQVEPENHVPGEWSYLTASAAFTEGRIELSQVKPLPHFSSQSRGWQWSEAFPDPDRGYLRLVADGGHPPNPSQVAVLRLTVAQSGRFGLDGFVHVPSLRSSGLDLHFLRNGHPLHPTLSLDGGGKRALPHRPVNLQKGDVLDFVVHAGETAHSDGFFWEIGLRTVPVASPPPRKLAARAKEDFRFLRDVLAGTNGPGAWTYQSAKLTENPDGSVSLSQQRPIRFLDDETLKLTPRRQFPIKDQSGLGYLSLYPEGGHPGVGEHVVVRRWAPNVDGVFRIKGQLQRPSPEGDGIQAYAIQHADQVLEKWDVTGQKPLPTDLAPLNLKAGTPLSFVVAAGTSDSHDSFQWTLTIERLDESGKVTFKTLSEREFRTFAKIKTGQIKPGNWTYHTAIVRDGKGPALDGRLSHRDPDGSFRLPDAARPLRLSAEGGHAGDGNRIALRRWISDRNADISLESIFQKVGQGGDGVTAVVRHSRLGLVHRSHLANAEKAHPIRQARIPMRSGDALDFYVLPGNSGEGNEYTWSPILRWEEMPLPGQVVAHSQRDLLDDRGIPISHLPTQYPWVALAQTLLISNEFMFVD
ncbi:MAG: DUF1553 domain-containing protein, partial [Verrucomicrobiota bacterium]